MANLANVRRLVSVLLASLLILLSWGGIYSTQTGLICRSLEVEGIPMQFLAPQQADHTPGILIAHGFSGSKQLMLGYAHVLAHNGYGVLLWDLPGHGANTQPFAYDSLQDSFNVAMATLQQQPEIDPQNLAAIGHSMGGGVVLRGGIEKGDQLDAVIAISSTEAPVSPELPHNLMLQLGEWESYLLKYAQQLLNQAGGANPDLLQGKGRSLLVIPSVEHATILFSDLSHQAALNWLNQTFARTSANPYQDRRMAWYGLHLLGWVIAIACSLPTIASSLLRTSSPSSPKTRPLATWGGLLLAPIAAAMALKFISLQIPIDHLGGLSIGGALGLWMFLAGLVWMGVMGIGQTQFSDLFCLPTGSDIKIGAIGCLMLWLGFALAQWVWLPWFLTPIRLLLWLAITLACIPWFLASGIVQYQAKLGDRWGWWLGQSLVLVLGLTGTLLLLPSLGFLAIMLPIFPILVGLFSFMAAKTVSPWGSCLACAPIFGWLVVTPFPLV